MRVLLGLTLLLGLAGRMLCVILSRVKDAEDVIIKWQEIELNGLEIKRKRTTVSPPRHR